LPILQTRSRWPNTLRIVAAVSAGMTAFGSQLGQASEDVIGPSQWETGLRESPTVGPTSEWFVNTFQKEFETAPDYVSAGAYASVLIAAECIRQAASLDSDSLRRAVSRLNCDTSMVAFRLTPEPEGSQGIASCSYAGRTAPRRFCPLELR
jgi:ABC-type branched-subunit amino acid transport system substrate-binding protein